MVARSQISSIICPFTVLVDGREKAPYRFQEIHADASQRQLPILITTRWEHLKTGDYAICGCEQLVAVERKSVDDLYGTLGSSQRRLRFELEHQRLAELKRSAVVIEGSWPDILSRPPAHSQLNPKSVWRTSVSWYVRYGVPWIAAGDRRLAELWTFRFLEKMWYEFRKEHTHGAHARNH